jgi:hypothetical protein
MKKHAPNERIQCWVLLSASNERQKEDFSRRFFIIKGTAITAIANIKVMETSSAKYLTLPPGLQHGSKDNIARDNKINTHATI